jgi:putative PIN family toxin of toxin-antitoxin system
VIRAVLDTNVLASAMAGAGYRKSVPGEVFRRWRRRSYRLVVSRHILDELERTLANPYFSARFTPDQVARALRTFGKRGEWASMDALVSGVASHPEDDPILATAVSASADYLVTGDRMLQRLGSFGGVAIVGPREFIMLLERLEQDDEIVP